MQVGTKSLVTSGWLDKLCSLKVSPCFLPPNIFVLGVPESFCPDAWSVYPPTEAAQKLLETVLKLSQNHLLCLSSPARWEGHHRAQWLCECLLVSFWKVGLCLCYYCPYCWSDLVLGPSGAISGHPLWPCELGTCYIF